MLIAGLGGSGGILKYSFTNKIIMEAQIQIEYVFVFIEWKEVNDFWTPIHEDKNDSKPSLLQINVLWIQKSMSYWYVI